MLREQNRSGTISLAGFYKRRAARILPPLWLYLCVIALLGFCGAIAPFHPLRDLVQPATFTFGFGAGPSAWQIRHTWSLCVEEQFYLLWPVILLFSCLTLIIATASFFFIESPIRNRFSVRRQPTKNLPEPSIDVSFSPKCMV